MKKKTDQKNGGRGSVRAAVPTELEALSSAIANPPSTTANPQRKTNHGHPQKN
jgi:hypothetical protein